MIYGEFAGVYDELMSTIPYETWFAHIDRYLREHGIGPDSGTICELGCGTGTMTELFAGAGYRMVGVDLSEEMLALARKKMEKSGSDILYIHQDMENLELAEPVEAVLCLCDSINYILEESALDKVFAGVRKYLKPGGLFLFDMKTLYCYRTVMGNDTWFIRRGDINCVWQNYVYEDEKINEYRLTVFQKEHDSQLYKKFHEAHYQRIYEVKEMKALLKRSGFKVEACLDGHMWGRPAKDCERVYIIARKSEKGAARE